MTGFHCARRLADFRGMATKYRRDTPPKPAHGDVNDKVLDRLEKPFI